MKPKILVDTCVWIDFFRGTRSPEALALIVFIKARNVHLCGPIILEVTRGIRSSSESKIVTELFEAVDYIETEREDWEEAGAMLRDLQRRGITVPLADALIARLAIKADCEVLTLDEHFKHFKKVRRYKVKGGAKR